LSTDNQRLQRLLDNPDWSEEDREWLTSYLEGTDAAELKTVMTALYEHDLAAGEPLEPEISSIMRRRIAEGTGVDMGQMGLDVTRLGLDAGLSGQDAARMDREVIPMGRDRGRTRMLRRFRWVAAAAILLLLTGGVWFLADRRGNAPAFAGKVPVSRHDAAPGGNKALLTMADGHVIVLDSAANGQLALQGNVKVLKLDSGLLAYEAAANHKLQAASRLEYNTITTPRGGQYQVVLPDGTRVWLNAASSLQFPTSFTGKDRTVTLKGEAYFEVAGKTAHPFYVKMPHDAVIEVLGTHFNVNAYEDEPAARATLLEGGIRIRKKDHVSVLKPGQEAVMDNAGDAIQVSNDADLDEAVAWKNGMFVFNSLPLESIMRQMERWYDVEVSYRGNVKGISFNGQISRYSQASQMLDMLATTGEVHFTMENKKIIVSP
jgi:ferric-dicitrate binding protein FerR (iron transport regulator)